jgi:hypothetical protein
MFIYSQGCYLPTSDHTADCHIHMSSIYPEASVLLVRIGMHCRSTSIFSNSTLEPAAVRNSENVIVKRVAETSLHIYTVLARGNRMMKKAACRHWATRRQIESLRDVFGPRAAEPCIPASGIRGDQRCETRISARGPPVVIDINGMIGYHRPKTCIMLAQ